MSAIDLTGRRFGSLTVIERVPDPQCKRVYWSCRCDCGNTCVRTTYVLTHGISASCGCVRRENPDASGNRGNRGNRKPGRHPRSYYEGKTYGRLTGVQGGNNGEWLWRCSCGGLVYASIDDVASGRITNCGCIPGEPDRRVAIPPPDAPAPAPEHKDKRNQPHGAADSKIARMRVARGLSQAQLARIIGLHPSAIGFWEIGNVKPSKQSLLKLAAALQCDLDELVDIPVPKCRVCGRELQPPRRVYCSDECEREEINRKLRVKHPRKHPDGVTVPPRVCQDCGAQYTGNIKSKRCPKCQDAADRRAKAKSKQRQAKGNVRRIGSTDYCARCGEPYIVTGSRRRYCKDCAEQVMRENLRANERKWYREHYVDPDKRAERNAARRKGWQAERTCPICGKEFVASSHNVKFCSDECRIINTNNRRRIAYARRKGNCKQTRPADKE